MDKFFSRCLIFASKIAHPNEHTKNVCSILKCTSDRDTTRNIAFCSLLPKQHLRLSFLTCFHQKFFAMWLFFSLNVVLTSKIRYFLKNSFHNSNTSVKGVEKNVLKAWNFTKNRLCHRYFDNNLQKIFRTNILRKKCPYSELFWCLFSRIRTRITPNMRISYAVTDNFTQ